MEPLTVAQCRKLIGQPANESLADEGVIQLRDMLYSLADVIADAYADLNATDQRAFDPPNDLDVWLRDMGEGFDGQ
jgi:hypothetical protein